jgi:hypothetical protein
MLQRAGFMAALAQKDATVNTRKWLMVACAYSGMACIVIAIWGHEPIRWGWVYVAAIFIGSAYFVRERL